MRSGMVHGLAFAGVWDESQYPSNQGGMAWAEKRDIDGYFHGRAMLLLRACFSDSCVQELYMPLPIVG